MGLYRRGAGCDRTSLGSISADVGVPRSRHPPDPADHTNSERSARGTVAAARPIGDLFAQGDAVQGWWPGSVRELLGPLLLQTAAVQIKVLPPGSGLTVRLCCPQTLWPDDRGAGQRAQLGAARIGRAGGPGANGAAFCLQRDCENGAGVNPISRGPVRSAMATRSACWSGVRSSRCGWPALMRPRQPKRLLVWPVVTSSRPCFPLAPR